MRKIQILALITLLSLASAAYVRGDIYQSNLEKLNKTLLKVNGPFSYQVVTDKANYSLFLPEGEYNLSASAFDDTGNLRLYAQENVKVGSTDQKIDLVLKPAGAFDIISFYPFLAIAFVAGVLFYLKPWEKKQKIKYESSNVSDMHQIETAFSTPKQIELDTDAKSVLKILDSFEGRTTQKDLKETLNFSDAKLSLILTELEQLGHIKKFKRGRGNIIKKI